MTMNILELFENFLNLTIQQKLKVCKYFRKSCIDRNKSISEILQKLIIFLYRIIRKWCSLRESMRIILYSKMDTYCYNRIQFIVNNRAFYISDVSMEFSNQNRL